MKTDREKFSNTLDGDYYWCLHCERAYHKKDLRTVIDQDGFLMEMCHYPNCNGDAVIDAWDWEKIRDAHPDYPEVPEVGKQYPLYN